MTLYEIGNPSWGGRYAAIEINRRGVIVPHGDLVFLACELWRECETLRARLLDACLDDPNGEYQR